MSGHEEHAEPQLIPPSDAVGTVGVPSAKEQAEESPAEVARRVVDGLTGNRPREGEVERLVDRLRL